MLFPITISKPSIFRTRSKKFQFIRLSKRIEKNRSREKEKRKEKLREEAIFARSNKVIVIRRRKRFDLIPIYLEIRVPLIATTNLRNEGITIAT